MLPSIGIRLDAFTAGVLALTLNYSAYISEVYRGGIQAIARGQHDAAAALGMTHGLAMRRIILPQAMRIVLPVARQLLHRPVQGHRACSAVSIQELVYHGAGAGRAQLPVFHALYCGGGHVFRGQLPGRAAGRVPGARHARGLSPETGAAMSVSSPGPMIRIEDLHKHFGELHVLSGIDLSVAKGEVVCVIGPSGSGKSTLLRCINHLEMPERGRIWIDGQLAYRDEESAASSGRIPTARSRRCARRSAWCSSSSICFRT